jgi:hypothetical protein
VPARRKSGSSNASTRSRRARSGPRCWIPAVPDAWLAQVPLRRVGRQEEIVDAIFHHRAKSLRSVALIDECADRRGCGRSSPAPSCRPAGTPTRPGIDGLVERGPSLRASQQTCPGEAHDFRTATAASPMASVTRPRAICLEDDPAVKEHNMFVDIHLAMIHNL